MSTAQDQIRDLLGTSERSLNTSDAALAAISLDVTFTIDELVVTSNDVAYAPTRSNGTRRGQRRGTRSQAPLEVT